MSIPPDATATAQPPPSASLGSTVAAYAAAKGLPVDFLTSRAGLSDVAYRGTPAVRIPYLDADGTETAIRLRLALAKGEEGDRHGAADRISSP